MGCINISSSKIQKASSLHRGGDKGKQNGLECKWGILPKMWNTSDLSAEWKGVGLH